MTKVRCKCLSKLFLSKSKAELSPEDGLKLLEQLRLDSPFDRTEGTILKGYDHGFCNNTCNKLWSESINVVIEDTAPTIAFHLFTVVGEFK